MECGLAQSTGRKWWERADATPAADTSMLPVLPTQMHTCSPSDSGSRGRRILWVHEFKVSLGNTMKLHLRKIKQTNAREESGKEGRGVVLDVLALKW